MTDDALTAAVDLAYVRALKQERDLARAEVERLKTIYAELLQQSLKTMLEAVEATKRAEKADADAAAAREACDWVRMSHHMYRFRVSPAAFEKVQAVLAGTAGAALLSELGAARELRKQIVYPNLDDLGLDDAVEAYDAAAKGRDVPGAVSLLSAARDLIAQLRTEYSPGCACDVCRAIAAYDQKVRRGDG